MKNTIRKLRSSMSVNLIGGLVGMLLMFGLTVSVVGNRCFVSAFKHEYATTTYHMADAAAVMVNGDHIDDYLAGREQEEYAVTKRRLDVTCTRLNVSLVYVIRVDTSDYGRFVSVFNSVNNAVDDTSYTEWEPGFWRDTTNDEYREAYRALYAGETEYGTVFRLHTTGDVHPHITTLVPVKNSAGEVTAILCVQRPMSEMRDALQPYYMLVVYGIVLTVAVTAFLVALFLRRAIIRPVEKVSQEASRFARENTKGEPLRETGRYDVIRELAHSIEGMETDIVKYVETMTAEAAEKERAAAELQIAAEIQEGSLPSDFPAFPDRREFDIYASMDPAKEVGGDFYNFFLLDDDHLALLIADVSGKGFPGALFMMVSNIVLNDRAQMGGSPSEILAFVNENICRHNPAGMFVTVWLGILEISTGRLTYANAGHEDFALCRKGGRFEVEKERHGFVIGGMEGICWKDRELTLGPGDRLFLYTDGLPEATDAEERMYTIPRMLDALNEHREKSPQGILEGVTESVAAFVREAPQFDDLTMLCLEYRGPQTQKTEE